MRVVVVACALVACGNSQSPAALGRLRWATTIGGPTNDLVEGAAVDSAGSVVVIGGFSNPLLPGTHVFPGITNGFVEKRAMSDGAQVWRRELVDVSAHSSAEPTALTIDRSDNIFMSGRYSGVVDFGGQTLGTDGDPPTFGSFLAKYSPDGQLQWVRDVDVSARITTAGDLAVDGDGHVVVAGTFTDGTFTLTGEPFTEEQGRSHGFTAAFDPSGSVVWAQLFKGSDKVVALRLSTSSAGDAIVVGWLSAPATFGTTTLSPDGPERGAQRAFLVRCASDGTVREARTIGTEATSSAEAVVATDDGGAVVYTREHDANMERSWLHAISDNGADAWEATQNDQGMFLPVPRTLAPLAGGRILSSGWADDAEHDAAFLTVTAYGAEGVLWEGRYGSGDKIGVGGKALLDTVLDASGAGVFVGRFDGTVRFGAVTLKTPTPYDADGFLFVVSPPAE
jgi:hypothetical protein